MQPTEAGADPAGWAEGQLQPTSHPAESHGSAPSIEDVLAGDADTADSAAAGAGPTAGADGSRADGARQEDGLQNMQVDAAHELESSMLSKGEERGWILCSLPCLC